MKSRLSPPPLSTLAAARYVLQVKTYPEIPDATIRTWANRIGNACRDYQDSNGTTGLPCSQRPNGRYTIAVTELERWYEAQELGVCHR